jgi:hypothetical protein
MAEDVDDSVSYLKALKQSSGSHEATAAAPARDASNQSPEPRRFHGAEKRRSIRYKCEGSATIREEGTDVHTWATFTDVSLHGCYVEAQATYAVGKMLHLKLEANGVTVMATGVVRVSYPCLGMGIAFTAVTQEVHDSLRELLGSITHPTGIMGPGIASTIAARAKDSLPPVTDPAAAVLAIVDFFESRQMLMREDFLRLMRTSQGTNSKP